MPATMVPPLVVIFKRSFLIAKAGLCFTRFISFLVLVRVDSVRNTVNEKLFVIWNLKVYLWLQLDRAEAQLATSVASGTGTSGAGGPATDSTPPATTRKRNLYFEAETRSQERSYH